MRLSTRLTIAMVALVLLTASAIGVLNYRNATAAGFPARSIASKRMCS